MVKVFKAPKANRNRQKTQQKTVTIDALDHHGVGVVRSHQPVLFVEGALPGERCKVSIQQHKKQYCRGNAIDILEPSESRVLPFCQHSTVCGGCNLDFVQPDSARQWRRQAISDLLGRLANIDQVNWLDDIVSEPLGYRRKTRIAIDARDPQNILVGYRQAKQRQVFTLQQCPVLTESLQVLSRSLVEWVKQCPQAKHLGHITLFEADDTCLVQVKATRELSQSVITSLTELGTELECVMQLQCADKSVETLAGANSELTYSPIDNINIEIGADDFVQVNHDVNIQMVAQVIAWLEKRSSSRVLDLFCGTGNFSLAMASKGFQVTGVEGVETMVERATASAKQYALNQCSFLHHDLQNPHAVQELLSKDYDAVVLDPSREGAKTVCERLSANSIQTVVYVSCNPATFARDAQQLRHNGFELDAIRFADMFSYTQHAELIALFTAKVQ